MTVSTNGQLCYGVQVKDGEHPWENFDSAGWWLDICGWKPPFELYDEEGNYINGEEPPKEKVREYYEALDKFTEEHPPQVEIVTHCSDGYPMYIVAMPGTFSRNYRGDPVKIENLNVPEGASKFLKDFCEKHNIPTEGDPAWWLSSYWG